MIAGLLFLVAATATCERVQTPMQLGDVVVDVVCSIEAPVMKLNLSVRNASASGNRGRLTELVLYFRGWVRGGAAPPGWRVERKVDSSSGQWKLEWRADHARRGIAAGKALAGFGATVSGEMAGIDGWSYGGVLESGGGFLGMSGRVIP